MIWEYLVARMDHEGVIFVGDGEKESAGVYRLNELGHYGWELVSVSGWNLNRALAIFKRQQRDVERIPISQN